MCVALAEEFKELLPLVKASADDAECYTKMLESESAKVDEEAQLLADITVTQCLVRELKPGEDRQKLLSKCRGGIEKRDHLKKNLSGNLQKLLDEKLQFFKAGDAVESQKDEAMS